MVGRYVSFAVCFIAMILVALPVHGQIDSYNITFTLDNEKDASVEAQLVIQNETTLLLTLPYDARRVAVTVDDSSLTIQPLKAENILILKIPAEGAGKIALTYTSSVFVEKSKHAVFVAEIKPPSPAKQMLIKLILPQSATLSKNPSSSTGSSSVLPKPQDIGTDGSNIIITWDGKDIDDKTGVSVMAIYDLPRSYLGWVIGLIITLLGAGIIILLLSRRPEKVREVVKEVNRIDEHLKEDEEQIISILKTKGGSCEQGTIVLISGMSKAYVSRILSELEERKVIVKEESGKRNIIHLKSGLWNSKEQ